ncbi:MAG: hypothetical protein ACLFO4_03215 [Candidatus Acetothermia bacterium]
MKSLEVLERANREGSLTHAYLAPVRPGTDLENYAVQLGRTILCPRDDDRCVRKVLRNTHPDFFWVTPKDDKRKISINQVEEIISGSSYSPQERERKVYAIGRAEDLTREASNSLLKVLEDPPGYVFFLLLTGNPDDLLPTILSRCQRLPTGGTDPERMKKALTEEGYSEEEARYLIQVVNERAEVLERLLGKPPAEPLEKRKDYVGSYEGLRIDELAEKLIDSEGLIEKEVLSRLIFENIGNAGKYELLDLAGKLKDLSREDLTWFMERGIFLYRKNYRRWMKSGGGSADESSKVYLKRARILARGIESLKTNANLQLLVESLCLQLASGNPRFN